MFDVIGSNPRMEVMWFHDCGQIPGIRLFQSDPVFLEFGPERSPGAVVDFPVTV